MLEAAQGSVGNAGPGPSASASALTVVVPTYNESQNLPELVARILSAVPSAEIVVIDDNSPDGTAEVAAALGRTLPVRMVCRTSERGLSTAVLRGFEEARTDVCVVLDADLSHPPEAIPKLVEALENGAEVAVGSRYVKGGSIDAWPLWRRICSGSGTLLARPLTSVRDPMSGFFATRKSLVEGAALQPRGFKILLELLARTGTKKVAEIPIRFEDRAAGASKFGAKERREFLKQVCSLYLSVGAWPVTAAASVLGAAAGVLIRHFLSSPR
jgi:dolichol-phosphate mannosyltransferase